MIVAAASMSTDFAYAPTNQQEVAVFIGVILFHGLLNTLNTAWLARITSVKFPAKILTSVLRYLQYWVYVGSNHCLVSRTEKQK